MGIVKGSWRLPAGTAKRCVLFLFSTVVALGMAEMALRLVRGSDPIDPPAYVGQNRNRPSRNFEPDTKTGWRMQRSREFEWEIDTHRNVYRSNRQGFRSDRDFDHPSSMLIGAVGDSFTWGTGVEYSETFGHLIEKGLEGTTVYNFAMPGFGIDQMWMSVRHQILPLHPSLVVVAFIDDDLERSLMAYRQVEGLNKPRFVLSQGKLRPQTSADVPSLQFVTLASHSQLWIGTVRTISRLRELWTLNEAIFEAIASDCEQQGVPVVFVRLSDKQSRPSEPLTRFFSSKGLSFIDIPSRQPQPKDMHFKRDGHINAQGHAFVAETITDWVKQSTSLTKPDGRNQ